MDLDPTSELTVYCECGCKYTVSGSHMNDSIDCGMCGRRIRVKGSNSVRAGAPDRTALQAYAEKHGDEEKIAQACHYAKEHKYAEALTLYEGVLAAHTPLRDAFYGMGYCHYRLGDAHKAMVFLQLARQCGHTTALELLRKVEGSLDTPHRAEQV